MLRGASYAASYQLWGIARSSRHNGILPAFFDPWSEQLAWHESTEKCRPDLQVFDINRVKGWRIYTDGSGGAKPSEQQTANGETNRPAWGMAILADQGDGLALFGVCNGRVLRMNTDDARHYNGLPKSDIAKGEQVKENSMTAELSAVIAALVWTISMSHKGLPTSIYSDSLVSLGLADATIWRAQ